MSRSQLFAGRSRELIQGEYDVCIYRRYPGRLTKVGAVSFKIDQMDRDKCKRGCDATLKRLC